MDIVTVNKPNFERDLEMFEMALRFIPILEIAKKFNISRTRVDQCIRGVARDFIRDREHVMCTPEGFYPGADCSEHHQLPTDVPRLINAGLRGSFRIGSVEYERWLYVTKIHDGPHIRIFNINELFQYRDYWFEQIKQLRTKLRLRKEGRDGSRWTYQGINHDGGQAD